MIAKILTACLLIFISLGAANAYRKPITKKLIHRVRTAEEIRAYQKNLVRPHRFYSDVFAKDVLIESWSVGTPHQNIWINMELARNKLWILDTTYPKKKRGLNTYKPEKSTTSFKTGRDITDYTGTAKLTGHEYYDLAYYVGTFNQSICVAFESVDRFGEPLNFEIDGIAGYAWNPKEDLKNPTETSSLVLNQMKDFENRIMSLWLQTNFDGYEISLGIHSMGWSLENSFCDNNTNYAPLTYYNDYALSSFKMIAFKAGNYFIKKADAAIVDSGLSVIYVPTVVFNGVIKQLAPTWDEEHHYYVTDCSRISKLPTWDFNINNKVYSLDPKYYIMDYGLYRGKCVVTIAEAVTGFVPWALGNPFLRQFCTHFDIDKNQIGFSTAFHFSRAEDLPDLEYHQ